VDSRLKLTFAQLVSKSTHHGLWTPLVAVDQKANPAYQGFYNGGGSRRRCMARRYGGRKSPSGVEGQSPGRSPGGRSPPEVEAQCEISVQLLTFSCRKFRI